MSLDKNFDIKDNVVAITGAGGVLCAAMAHALGDQGAKIVLLDIGEESLKRVGDELSAKDIDFLAVKCNVLDKASIQEAADKAIAHYGHVDVLINGAGGNKPGATTNPNQSFFELPEDAVNWVMNLNFMGTFLPAQIFGKHFAERGEGNIINISSMNAFTPLTRIPAYSAAKAAVSNFTQWLAVHMSQNYSGKIRVNAIAPGFLLTNQNRFLLTNESDGNLTDRGKTIIDHTPMARFGDPEDLISTIQWLVAPGSSFVHGIVVPVDGGFSSFSGV